MLRLLSALLIVLWTTQAVAQDATEPGSPDASDEAGEVAPETDNEGDAPETDNEGDEPADAEDASETAVVPPRVLRSELPVLPDGDFPDEVVLRIELTIDAEGRLAATRWLESLDDVPEALRAAAMTHVATLVFEAARRGDTPIASRVPYEVRFPPRLHLAAPEVVTEVATETSTSELPAGADHEHEHEHEPHEHHEHDDEPADEDEPEFGATAEIDAGTRALPNAAASERTLSLEMLRDVPRTNAEQMLAMAGVVLANHAGEGHASSLFLRGFDAGEGQDLEVLVDGIPLNEPSNAHLHGYADSGFLIPELVQSVRVLPGPFDVAQGDFALAGTAEYSLGLAERGFQLLGGYGSYRRRRALLLYGDGDKSFAGLEIQAGRGFGVNRAHQNIRAIARYSGGDEALGYSITAASHALDFDSAGVVREDAVATSALPCDADADSQFFCTPDPNQGGAASRHLLALSLWSSRPGIKTRQTIWAQLRRSRFRENFTGFLLDERGDGLDEQTDGGNIGARTDIQVQGTFGERELTLDFGLLARHDRVDTHIWRNRDADDTPYRVVSDNTLGLTTTAAYLSAGFRSKRVAVRAGARLAGFAFAMEDHNQPDVDRSGERVPSESRDAFGVALLPRATLVVALLKDTTTLDWVSSIGRGARSSDAAALSDGENAPFATSRSIETGFRLGRDVQEPGEFAFDAQVGGFWTSVDRDLLFDSEAGRNILIGRTERFGAYVNGRLRLTGWFEAVGSFTWSEAHLPGEDAGPFAITDGPRLPFVPRFVGRVDVALRRDVKIRGQRFTFGAALGGGVLGRRPLPLENLGERIATLDASVRARWRFVEIAVLARNLTDNRYRQTELHYESNFDPEGLASLRAARHFAAGAPREIFATVTLFLDTDILRFGGSDAQPEASETDPETAPETTP